VIAREIVLITASTHINAQLHPLRRVIDLEGEGLLEMPNETNSLIC
jgi:hypothetical protein